MKRVQLVSLAVLLGAGVSCWTASARADEGVTFIPVLRLALGPSIHLAPASEEGTRLAVDITAGLGIAVGREKKAGFIFNPELGYAFDGLGTHAFNLSAGIGFGHPLAYVSYQPRLLAGSASGSGLIGMRNGAVFHVLYDMGSLEIGHQFESHGGIMHQGVVIMVGVNPAAFVYAISKL